LDYIATRPSRFCTKDKFAQIPFMNQLVRRGALGAFIVTIVSCGATKRTGSNQQENTIIWQAKPIVVDGNNNDWEIPYRHMDEKAKIQYSFSNDKENLYITLKAGDRMTQMKMLTAGMKVLIDIQGKKSPTTGILFPLENHQPIQFEINEPKADFAPDQNTALAKRLSSLISNAREFSLQGFNDCNGTFLIAQKNKCGIETKMGTDLNNELIWEVVVPFKSFYKGTIDSSDLGKVLSVGFEINALKKPEMPSAQGAPGGPPRGGMSPGAGMPSGGNGMPPGGGMPPGRGGSEMGGPDMEDRMKAFEASSTWVKIRLAYKEE
jgi:hypothetical protein